VKIAVFGLVPDPAQNLCGLPQLVGLFLANPFNRVKASSDSASFGMLLVDFGRGLWIWQAKDGFAHFDARLPEPADLNKQLRNSGVYGPNPTKSISKRVSRYRGQSLNEGFAKARRTVPRKARNRVPKWGLRGE
jgi:hypothetical protein